MQDCDENSNGRPAQTTAQSRTDSEPEQEQKARRQGTESNRETHERDHMSSARPALLPAVRRRIAPQRVAEHASAAAPCLCAALPAASLTAGSRSRLEWIRRVRGPAAVLCSPATRQRSRAVALCAVAVFSAPFRCRPPRFLPPSVAAVDRRLDRSWWRDRDGRKRRRSEAALSVHSNSKRGGVADTQTVSS